MHYINDKFDILVVMLSLMVKRMSNALQGWLGPDRIDSLPTHHSLIIPSYEIASHSANRTATGFACELQRFNSHGARAGLGRTAFEIIGECDTPTPPQLHPGPALS